LEAVGGWPEAGCELLKSSTAGCCAVLLKSSPDALGQGEAWLKALQSPKSPFPLVAVPEGKATVWEEGRQREERQKT